MADQHLVIELDEPALAELLMSRVAEACRLEGAVVRNIAPGESGERSLVIEGRSGSFWMMQREAVVDAAGDPGALAELQRAVREELRRLRAGIDAVLGDLSPVDFRTARLIALPPGTLRSSGERPGRGDAEMELSALLEGGRVRCLDSVKNKTELLRNLSALLCAEGDAEQVEAAFRALAEREEYAPTGIGHGIALPHARTSTVGGLTAAAVLLSGGIDYGAIDGRPVRLAIAVLAANDRAGAYIALLQRAAQLFDQADIRRAVLDASGTEDVLRVLREVEASPSLVAID